MIGNSPTSSPLRCPRCGLEAAHSRDAVAEAALNHAWSAALPHVEQLTAEQRWWHLKRKRALQKAASALHGAASQPCYQCTGCSFRFLEIEAHVWSAVTMTEGGEQAALDLFAATLEEETEQGNAARTDGKASTPSIVHPETGETLRMVPLTPKARR